MVVSELLRSQRAGLHICMHACRRRRRRYMLSLSLDAAIGLLNSRPTTGSSPIMHNVVQDAEKSCQPRLLRGMSHYILAACLRQFDCLNPMS